MAYSQTPEEQPKRTKKNCTKSFTDPSNFIIFNKTIMAKHPDIEINRAPIYDTYFEMFDTLKTDNDCREHLEQLRWNGEPICPHCGSQRENHYKMKSKGVFRGQYKCKDCRIYFTVTVGTIFHGSNIGLRKWFFAIQMFLSDKKGMSSLHLSRATKITQKTAWFMLSRIRYAFANRVEFEFAGIVQVDETYVGGKNKNRNKNKRKKGTQGRSLDKTPVFGMISDGLVYTEVVPNTQGSTLRPIIRKKVKEGSIIVSDGWRAYKRLSKSYQHEVIPHNKGVYKMGEYHTNSIEGFWSQLKRGIIGVYHVTSAKHLHRYCDEFAFRYNTRHMDDGERFNLSLIMTDERLTYKDLISA